MHLLFVHQNYPAQFGHIADYLHRLHGAQCTFVSRQPAGRSPGIERITYPLDGGATEHNHYCSRTFENTVWHAHGVHRALQARPDIRPDLIVGHSGFGSTLFLRELYPNVPILNYFEYFYRPRNSDMDFRPEFPSTELNRLRAYARNAMLLLDLENCSAGYAPTRWQRDRLPAAYRPKVEVIFDGVDTSVWKPMPGLPRRLLNPNFEIPPHSKIVTYATRGMESMRGFDIFMEFARRLAAERSDVHFVIAGQDRVCYGGDAAFTGGLSFKQWVLSRASFDLSRFTFLGLVPPATLAHLFNLSDLHVYWTVPFVLSWSLMNALACGATVLASATEPVQEMIDDGVNGLLVDFHDVDAMLARARDVLDHPADFGHLGQNATARIAQSYSLEACLPQMLNLYRRILNQAEPPSPAP
jgi:glycosyltransferase involved in cell wall biosynthesis